LQEDKIRATSSP